MSQFSPFTPHAEGMTLEAALRDLAAAQAREARVRALHREHDASHYFCNECVDDWPCATICALDGTDGGA